MEGRGRDGEKGDVKSQREGGREGFIVLENAWKGREGRGTVDKIK